MSTRNLPEFWQALDDEGDGLPTPESPIKKNRPVRPPSAQEEELAALAALERGQQNFDFTYQASRHERLWLLQSLGAFHEHHWIDDVLRIVKGGKEASVYLCQAHATVGEPFIAAKVYRPRMLRNLRKDHLYREGRPNLDAEGREVINGGMLHAMNKRTAYGLELLHTSWIEHEFTTLQLLHAAGADVPRPYTSANNAILMSYIGEEQFAAPVLHAVRLDPQEARPLFERVLRNIAIMLANQRVHADLSAFNILYWDGEISLIDFPQAIHPEQNRNAYRIFERDVTRICEYFTRQGVPCAPRRLAADLWTDHGYRLAPDIHPALLDDQDEGDVAYWKSLHRQS